MTREEQISAIADILFYNTATGELTVEKCYELAEKIVNQATGSMVIPEGLEEAAQHDAILTYRMPEDGDFERANKTLEARIFHEIGFKAGAKWGEKNAYKAIMKKADEVRDKMYDIDYDIKIQYPKVKPTETIKD